MPRILTAENIQANADLLGLDYNTAYGIHVEDIHGSKLARVQSVNLDTGEVEFHLCCDINEEDPGMLKLVSATVKLNYFKLVSGSWYLEYKGTPQ